MGDVCVLASQQQAMHFAPFGPEVSNPLVDTTMKTSSVKGRTLLISFRNSLDSATGMSSLAA